MRRSMTIGGVILLLSFILPIGAYAGTDMIFTPTGGGFSGAEAGVAELVFEQYANTYYEKNKKVMPNAFALVNTLGYPNGKSAIKAFPHFEFGAAVGVGVVEGDRLDKFTKENPEMPFAGVNGGVHFGTGLADDIDLTVKFFTFNSDTFPSFDKSDKQDRAYVKIEMESLKYRSMGAKLRYTVLGDTTLVPLFLSFGGISTNLGVDYMKGKAQGKFQFTNLESITVGGTTTGTMATYNTVGTIDWSILSVTPEVFVYMDLLYFFSLYTGPSVSFNTGKFDVKMDGTGNLKTTGGTQIGTMTLTTSESFKPSPILPKWTVGLEINLAFFKLQVEAASLLTSPKDSGMVQVGARMQF